MGVECTVQKGSYLRSKQNRMEVAMMNNKVIVIPEGKICDYVDGKFRNDTPEEYVRQTIEKRLD